VATQADRTAQVQDSLRRSGGQQQQQQVAAAAVGHPPAGSHAAGDLLPTDCSSSSSRRWCLMALCVGCALSPRAWLRVWCQQGPQVLGMLTWQEAIWHHF
jgi:hypothetical protein